MNCKLGWEAQMHAKVVCMPNTDECIFEVCLINYKRNGDKFWNQFYLAPVHDEDHLVSHYMGIQSDVSNLMEQICDTAGQSAATCVMQSQHFYKAKVDARLQIFWLGQKAWTQLPVAIRPRSLMWSVLSSRKQKASTTSCVHGAALKVSSICMQPVKLCSLILCIRP